MSNNNLKLWEAVQDTAPGFTKQADLDGRKVTSINGTYMAKRATDLFGPMGIGWGCDVVEERFDQGAPVYSKEGVLLGHDVMHTIKLTLWYLQDGKRGEITHYGHTPYIRGTKYGLKTDFDAPKKSMTDAIKKCLSMLGFSADIFLGMFDDAEYVAAAKVKEQVAQAEEADDKVLELRTEFLAWVDREINSYSMVPNAAALRLMLDGHNKKALRQCHALNIAPEKIVERFKSAYERRRAELTPDINLVCTQCGSEGTGKPGSPCPDCGGERVQPQ